MSSPPQDAIASKAILISLGSLFLAACFPLGIFGIMTAKKSVAAGEEKGKTALMLANMICVIEISLWVVYAGLSLWGRAQGPAGP